MGLTWGGVWSLKDWGHVQAAPMSPTDYMGAMDEVSDALERKYGGQLNA